MAGVILQYVWRAQEVVRALAAIEFTAVVSVGAVVLFAANTNAARRLRHLHDRIFFLILAIFVLAVLSVPMSLHAGASFRFLIGNFAKTVVLVGVLAASIRDRADVDRLVRVFVLGGAAYVIASQVLASPNVQRLSGQGSYDPNDLGLFTVSTLPMCVYLARSGARWRDRALGIGAAVVLLLGTVQSGSRGGFLALVAVTLYGVVALDAVRRSKRLATVAAAGVVLLAVAGDAYWQRMSTLLNPQEDYNWSGQAESGRLEIWKRGVDYMTRRPLFGVGVDAFPVAEGRSPQAAARRETGAGFKWSAAHSAYIQIGAELGVFGLAAFVALLLLAFRTARRIGRTVRNPADRMLGQALGALLVGYAVGAAFLSQAYATYLYFVLGLLIGFSRVVNREELAQGAPQPALAAGAGVASGIGHGVAPGTRAFRSSVFFRSRRRTR